jgi:hypothetical protein
MVSAALTVLSGLVLHGRFAAVTQGAWMRTPAGVGYAVARLRRWSDWACGSGSGCAGVSRMQRIGRQAAAAGGAPGAAQAAEMQRLQARAGAAVKVASALLLLAAAVMGTARYW